MDSFVIGGEEDDVCLHVGVCYIQEGMEQKEGIDIIVTSKNMFVFAFLHVTFGDDLFGIISWHTLAQKYF